MKIAVLVDLTPLCFKAVEIGGMIAQRSGADLVLVHIKEIGASEDDAISELTKLKESAPAGVNATHHLGEGDFFSVIPTVVQDISSDLVVVPTHGKVGLMQNLFGANILKLVKNIPLPTLVVQQDSNVSATSFSKLLFPVGPHDDFDIKYRQTASFAKLFGSKVIIYTVRNDVRGISEKLRGNISASLSHFEQQNVAFEEVKDEPSGFSVGYTKHILEYAKNNDVDAICIMSKVSDENGYIGNSDKENVILNEHALPVLCANE